MMRIKGQACGISILLLLTALAAACGANQGVLQAGKESPNGKPVQAIPESFEKDVAAMKEADFAWIYVFRRRDGRELDTEDKRLIKAHASDTNRRVLSDNGKAVIIGSNYYLGDANLNALKDRFDFADFSKPGQPTPEQTPTPTPGKKK